LRGSGSSARGGLVGWAVPAQGQKHGKSARCHETQLYSRIAHAAEGRVRVPFILWRRQQDGISCLALSSTCSANDASPVFVVKGREEIQVVHEEMRHRWCMSWITPGIVDGQSKIHARRDKLEGSGTHINLEGIRLSKALERHLDIAIIRHAGLRLGRRRRLGVHARGRTDSWLLGGRTGEVREKRGAATELSPLMYFVRTVTTAGQSTADINKSNVDG